jgi:hypothetical protein
MKVICIDNTFDITRPDLGLRDSNYLTIGKIYDVAERGLHTYRIINDSGTSLIYDINMFITLDEYRQRQLNKILE